MSNTVDIIVQTKGEQQSKQALNSVAQAGENVNRSLTGIGDAARGIIASDVIQGIGASAVQHFKQATTAASDLGESMNAVDKIFGDSADEINKWGSETANSFGLSQRAFNQMAVPIGAGLKNVGIATDQVAALTIKLTERASDMASVFNKDVSQALEAIQAGLRGEADPLEQFGVGLNEAAVSAEALAMTGKKSAATITDQEKALARVNLIMKQTEATAGDFKDTSDSMANAQRIANAQIEEAQAKIGQGLLPVLAQAAQFAGALADGFSALSPPMQGVAGITLGLGAAFLFLAPKIVAVRDMVKEMNFSWATADTRMGNATRAAGRAATVLTAVAVTGAALSTAFANQLNPQVEELSENLAEFGTQGKKTGEAARLLGDDFSKFERDIVGIAATGAWADFERGAAGVIEGLTSTGDAFDDSFKRAKERVTAVDSALAQLVSTGRGKEAALAFEQLTAEAQKSGISIDELRAVLPQYSAAQAKANRETEKTTIQLEGQVIAFGDLADALRKQTDPMFAMIAAQQDLSTAQKDYNEAVKEHGKSSPEAQEALTKMAKAAIELSEAAAKAQGTFDGKLSPALRSTLQIAGFTEKQIADLEAAFNAARGAGDAFAKNYNATITTTFKEIGRAVDITTQFQSGIGGRAHGGIHGGGLTTINEQGFEVVDLPPGTNVHSNSDSQRMLESMGGMQEVRIVFEIIGGTEEERKRIRKMVKIYGNGSVQKAFGDSKTTV